LTLHLLDRALAIVSWTAAALVIVLLFAGPSLIGAKASNPTTPNGTSAPASGQVSGAQVFTSAGCSTCHTLKAAGATGSIGPDLDQLRPTAGAVSAVVRTGAGPMPSFSGKLNNAQIAAVASYVSSVAGR
jgi:mono/diheme cytochrome c family protein